MDTMRVILVWLFFEATMHMQDMQAKLLSAPELARPLVANAPSRPAVQKTTARGQVCCERLLEQGQAEVALR
ncbi:MAG: hypothetical protein AAFQ17_02940 [Pseudomonadota bacterium]